MDALSVGEERLRALLEAGLAVSSELSLDGLLHRIVEAAAELTGAQYAALGVIDPSGSELERSSRTASTTRRGRRSATLPRGRGILGVLISEANRCGCTTWPRIHARSASRPAIRRCARSSASPIVLARRRLRQPLPHREGGGEDFTEEDEELVDAACRPGGGRPIENARLYESATAGRVSSSRSRRSATHSPTRPTSTGCSISSSRRLRELIGRADRRDRPAGGRSRRS